MLNLPNGKHHFKGTFSYFFVDEKGNEQKESVSFEMELTFGNNAFTGTTIDEETQGLFDKSITVNGFLDGGFISFIVMYPHDYYFDVELNKLVVDLENDYPGCHYTGNYNLEKQQFEGEWELQFDEEKLGAFSEDYHTHYQLGEWVMSKVN